MTASSILRSASAWPASRPCSGLQSAGNPNSPSWLKLRARRAASAAEALFGGFPIQEFGVEQRLQHGRDHHIVVGIERADDFRDIQGGAQYVRAGVGQIEGACRREGGAQPLARRDRG